MDLSPFFPASLAAALPLAWLFLGLAVLRLKALAVCVLGLFLSLFLACLVWGLDLRLALEAVLDGTVFALIPILWIIAAAFFSYNLSQHTGAALQIKALLGGISPDPRIQALVIAWGLGSFMEAVAGFGTAVIIPTALLLSLGFSPFLAALVSLLANTVPVAFGVVGIPVQTLAWITDLDVSALALAVTLQLGLLTLAVPFCIVLCVTRSLSGLKAIWLPTLAAGLSFALAQFLVVLAMGPELAAVAGSLCSTLCVVLTLRLFPIKTSWSFDGRPPSPADSESPLLLRAQLQAWSPYILLFLLVLLSSKLVPPVHLFLGQFSSSLALYSGPGGKPLIIPWLTTPGTLALTGALLGGLWQGARPFAMVRIYGTTLRRLAVPGMTIISLVSMAKVLSYSGMMQQLAGDLALLAGSAYPALAPFLGALGSFITGSDTSANILFGALQKQAALLLRLDPVWIAAANASGACIGKLLSPQNLALATVAAGLAGQEGGLLRVSAAFAFPFLCIIAVLMFLLQPFPLGGAA
ncbi:MAG: L-lactate permease [Desulfovibrio sp.]|jgi:lactate permease|nr:L-lactate permease [Desulfovibrio sp.]